MTLDGQVCLCGLFCMNDECYNSLSNAQRQAVDQCLENFKERR